MIQKQVLKIKDESIKSIFQRYGMYLLLTASQIGNVFVLHSILDLTTRVYTYVLEIEYIHAYIVLYGLYHFISIIEQPVIGLISDRFCLKQFKR